MYSFNPTNPATDIGTFIIKGGITDNVTLGVMTEFSFKVTVKNFAPYFKDKLIDQRLTVGNSRIYTLP